MTTPDPATVAAITDGLTKAQREAMLSAQWIHPGGQDSVCLVVVDFTDPWTAPVAQFFTLTKDRLTPLGLAVKRHLEGTDNAR